MGPEVPADREQVGLPLQLNLPSAHKACEFGETEAFG